MPIEPSLGSPEALIFIDGYLSEGRAPLQGSSDHRLDANSQWWETIRQIGWQGSIYYLWWDASDSKMSLESFAQLGAGAIAQWQRHKSFAKRVGKSFLPKLTLDLEEESVSLLGFCLGAYVAYYAMHDWYKASLELKNAILLAGMVRRDRTKEWGKSAARTSGKLINVYNAEDLMLKRFCQILDWDGSPCGIKPIREQHQQILNFNATDLMPTAEHSSHNFTRALKEIALQKLWQI